jgi:hypothetical protein
MTELETGERMEYWLATSPLPGLILWIILYLSDYYLTLYSARGMKEIGHFQTEGSFELTPQFQKDIDALKPVSKRHILMLVASSLVLLLLWWLLNASPIRLPQAYSLYLGMFLLLEVAVHFRHLRNVFIIWEVRKNGGVEGQVTYRRWFTYKLSAFELYLFAGLFLIVAALTFSLFFLGGAIMCYGTGIKHSRLARKAKSVSSQTAAPSS